MSTERRHSANLSCSLWAQRRWAELPLPLRGSWELSKDRNGQKVGSFMKGWAWVLASIQVSVKQGPADGAQGGCQAGMGRAGARAGRGGWGRLLTQGLCGRAARWQEAAGEGIPGPAVPWEAGAWEGGGFGRRMGALLLASPVTSGKSLQLSEPQLPPV